LSCSFDRRAGNGGVGLIVVELVAGPFSFFFFGHFFSLKIAGPGWRSVARARRIGVSSLQAALPFFFLLFFSLFFLDFPFFPAAAGKAVGEKVGGRCEWRADVMAQTVHALFLFFFSLFFFFFLPNLFRPARRSTANRDQTIFSLFLSSLFRFAVARSVSW